jgi:type II secretion system protein N
LNNFEIAEFFLYFLFPFNDLGDKVAAQINQATGGQVSLNFENLDLRTIPTPGISLTEVEVLTPTFPKIFAKNIVLSPNLLGLVTFKPGVNASADGIFGGDASVSVRYAGANVQKKSTKFNIDASTSQVSLKELLDFMQISLQATGSIDSSTKGLYDLDFAEQPTSTIQVKGSKITLGDSQVFTPLGPLNLPAINFNDLVFESSLDKGNLEISKFTAGKPGGDLYANVSGRMELKVEKLGTHTSFRTGVYDLRIQLQMNEAFKQKMSMFLGFISAFSNGANSYSFRATGNGFYAPPNLSR